VRSADEDRLDVRIAKQLTGVAVDPRHAVALGEGRRSRLIDVAHGDEVSLRDLLHLPRVHVGDPAGADDPDPDLSHR
jgi:hypothetical protein